MFFYPLILGPLCLWTPALAATKTTRCLVGDSCFPSTDVLAKFNNSIGGKLFAERPLGSVCYRNDSAHNPAACNAITAVTSNPLVDQLREVRFPS